MYKLTPFLFRYSNGLREEMPLYDEYSGFYPGLSGWQPLFDMQHNFVPTRLLDWTTNLNVALFFALSAEDSAFPSVFVLQPCILNAKAQLQDPRPFNLRHSRYAYPDQYRSPDAILH